MAQATPGSFRFSAEHIIPFFFPIVNQKSASIHSFFIVLKGVWISYGYISQTEGKKRRFFTVSGDLAEKLFLCFRRCVL